MEFARPWVLVLLPLLILPLVWRRWRTARRFSSFRVLPPDPLSRTLELTERGLGALFVAALVVSLSGPRTLPRSAVGWTNGARLVFVVDQSASMFSPWSGESAGGSSKISVAREAILGFVQRRSGNQVALIGFGKSTVLYSPLTSDQRRFLETLPLLQTDLSDTVIDLALLRALDLLAAEESSGGSQAVILLSDGAGRVFGPEEIAERFRKAGVNLYWLVIEGGLTGDAGMDTLMNVLGSRGQTFSVGEVNELPQALDAVASLENRPMRVARWTRGRSWVRLSQLTALGALLALGVFAFGDRASRTRQQVS